MKMPDLEDVKELAAYVLMGDRELEDFKEQIINGDLEPENEEEVAQLIEHYRSIEEAVESFDDDEFEEFALVFGTSHAYPTAIRILSALNQPQGQVDLGISKEDAERAVEAYKRNVE
jgi:hypothetical protein